MIKSIFHTASCCLVLISSQLLFVPTYAQIKNVPPTRNVPPTPTSTPAPSRMNRTLIVGEWSEPGKCEQTRYVYTANNRYMLMEKQGMSWKTLYKGIYTFNQGYIQIAEGSNMGATTLVVKRLTSSTLQAEIPPTAEDNNSKPELINYVKCPRP